MFLDDGISRDSAPNNDFLASYLGSKTDTAMKNGVQPNQNGELAFKGVDNKAANRFSMVVIEQVRVHPPLPLLGGFVPGTTSPCPREYRQALLPPETNTTNLRLLQKSVKRAQEDDQGSTTLLRFSRTVSITCPHDGFRDGLDKAIGPEYLVVFWHDPETPLGAVQVRSSWLPGGGGGDAGNHVTDEGSRATRVSVPVREAHGGVQVEVAWDVPV